MAGLVQAREPGPQVAALNEGDVIFLKAACRHRFAVEGEIPSRLLSLVSLIVAICTGILLGGAAGFFLGAALFLLAAPTLSLIYDRFRNRDYLEVAQALAANDFQRFIADKRLDLSIDSILDVHKAYKVYLKDQLQNNIAPQLQPAHA